MWETQQLMINTILNITVFSHCSCDPFITLQMLKDLIGQQLCLSSGISCGCRHYVFRLSARPSTRPSIRPSVPPILVKGISQECLEGIYFCTNVHLYLMRKGLDFGGQSHWDIMASSWHQGPYKVLPPLLSTGGELKPIQFSRLRRGCLVMWECQRF